MTLLDSVAQRYHCRPSDIARSELWAWQIDLAVALVAADEEAKKDGKERLLPDPPPDAKPASAPAPVPAPTLAQIEALAAHHGGLQRIAIPEDGIW